jgi:response regulator RpfG family c-di-GMP phosphodiesterase
MNALAENADNGKSGCVLCVDDERQVLEGLAGNLRARYTVVTATSAADALAHVEQTPELDVIVTDMRMPGIDGAEFLRRCREAAPHVSRILLTGHADTKSAVAAVNDGQIFRFLTKPCPPPALLAAVDAAVSQTRLVTTETDLLERTLKGCIAALTEVLSLANPRLFGRATQLRELVVGIARGVGCEVPWHYEVAAMLSQLALASLPEDLLQKFQRGQVLSDDDLASFGRLPRIADALLAHIPRLEQVRAIIAGANTPYQPYDGMPESGEARMLAQGAQLLRTANEFMLHSSRGMTNADALAALRAFEQPFDPFMLEALGQLIADRDSGRRVLAVTIAGMSPGMILAQDLVTSSGVLIAARGYEITPTLIEKLRNYRQGSVHEPIHVVVHSSSSRDH